MKLTYTIDIDAPADVIFPYLEDHDKLKAWMSLEAGDYTSAFDPNHRRGAKFKRKLSEGGQVIEYEGIVIAYDKPYHFGILLENKQFSMQVDYRLSETDAGTRLSYQNQIIKSNWLVRTMMAKIEATLAKRVDEQLKTLKGIAEKIASSQTPATTETELTPDATITTFAPRLTIQTPEKSWKIDLEYQNQWRIGRANDNDIVINHQKVSRHHAQIERQDDRFILRDLGSANGTWLATQRIQSHTLTNGDTLQIGHAQLSFEA